MSQWDKPRFSGSRFAESRFGLPFVGMDGGGAPNLLSQIQAMFAGGKQGYIYDYHDPASVYLEITGSPPATPSVDGGLLGSLKDLSPNGNWARAGTDAARPTWLAAGYGLGDGISQYLRSVFTIAQPHTRITCYRGIGSNLFTATNNRMFAGVGVGGDLLYAAAANRHGIVSGAAGPTLPVAINTDMVIAERYNGATSGLARDGDSYVIGNAGTVAPAGVTMFAHENTTPSQFANMRIMRSVMIEGVLSTADDAICREWVSEFAAVNVFSPVTASWIAEGDSLTSSGGSVLTYWDAFFDGSSQSDGFNGQNFSVAGSTLATANARLATVQAAIAEQVARGKTVVASVWIGANPVGGFIPTIAELQTYWAALRSSGALVVAVTLTPQTVAVNPTFNTQRNILNPQIRAATTDWDGLADLAADATIGPDAAASNTTYYIDGLHLTTAGQVIAKSIIQPAVVGLT